MRFDMFPRFLDFSVGFRRHGLEAAPEGVNFLGCESTSSSTHPGADVTLLGSKVLETLDALVQVAFVAPLCLLAESDPTSY